MICPRCGNEISDTETICQFCHQEINRNLEFNDFRHDGFVQIRNKDDAKTTEPINYTPKYFNIAEFNIFVIAIVFILGVSFFTLFSLRFVQQKFNPILPTESVAPYTFPPTQPHTKAPAPTEEATVKNTVKSYSVEDIYGSWKIKGTAESDGVAISYYTFFDDGVVQQNLGSITYGGVFRDVSEGKEKTIYIMIEGILEGVFDYTLEGNKDDGYFLTIESKSGRSYVFEQAEAKAYKLEPIENFKINEDLIGIWETKDKAKDYEFYKDGTLIRNTGYTTTESVWTIDADGDITLKYMKETIRTLKLEYKLSKDKKKLKINNVLYYKTK